MKKSFYPDDIMEFRLNNSWIKGSLKNIIKTENKYILSLENSPYENLELKNNTLVFNNFSIETILKSSEKNFVVNQRVEFYDTENKIWSEANIESMNNNFYIVSYAKKNCINNTKILYKNNIRDLTKESDLIKLNLDKAHCYSLNNFEKFNNPIKLAKKFINKLLNLLGNKILYTFLNKDLELFLFINETDKENELNNNSQNEIINGLIEVAVKHFEEMEKINKNLFK
jgi:hypothetical protein